MKAIHWVGFFMFSELSCGRQYRSIVLLPNEIICCVFKTRCIWSLITKWNSPPCTQEKKKKKWLELDPQFIQIAHHCWYGAWIRLAICIFLSLCHFLLIHLVFHTGTFPSSSWQGGFKEREEQVPVPELSSAQSQKWQVHSEHSHC